MSSAVLKVTTEIRCHIRQWTVCKQPAREQKYCTRLETLPQVKLTSWNIAVVHTGILIIAI